MYRVAFATELCGKSHSLCVSFAKKTKKHIDETNIVSYYANIVNGYR